MGIFDLLENTVEGVVETTVGVAKTFTGLALDPLNVTGLQSDGLDQMTGGVPKIGRAKNSKEQSEK